MTERPRITTRAQLIDTLRLAAELEHGLMCQYLFAAYSLKRYPYECWNGPDRKTELMTQADLERVRRWAMKITLIARQEMEHLGLALNMISAIGGAPSFSRPNMPQRKSFYGEARIKLELTTCDLDTIKRFQSFEAPDGMVRPGKLVKQKKALRHCDKDAGEKATPEQLFAALMARDADASMFEPDGDESDEEPGLVAGAPHVDLYGIPFKDVQELYQTIAEGFTYVSNDLGEQNLFVGNAGNQVYGGPPSPLYGSMNDLNQYGLSLIQVNSLKTALQAVLMIIEQGEGAPSVPPMYLPNTHFCLFTSIRTEMEADHERLASVCARPVARNPMTRLLPDVTEPNEVTLIRNDDTRAVADLFNQSYELMLQLLLYLYGDQSQTEEQTNALMDAAFFPLMTMFIRPLAEILTELPMDDDPSVTAGPGFELSGDVILLPSLAATWTMFQERIDALKDGFVKVAARKPVLPPKGHPLEGGPVVRPVWGWLPANDPWLSLPSQQFEEVKKERQRLWNEVKKEGKPLDPNEQTLGANAFAGVPFTEHLDDPPSLPWLRLYYLRENIERLAVNWKNNWTNVGRTSNWGKA